MVVQIDKLLRNIITKQAKIAHVPCDFIVFKSNDIPENIASKITEQYSEDFLGDAQYVIFCKGPIDKEMREKIFKCVDKALGGDKDKKKNANLLNVSDFKLLKMHDEDEDIDISQDDENQSIDTQVDDIVNEPEEDVGQEEEEMPDLEDNGKEIDNALSDEDMPEPEDSDDEIPDVSDEDDAEEDSDSEENIKESIRGRKDLLENNEDNSAEDKPSLPTRYVFLKISFKK